MIELMTGVIAGALFVSFIVMNEIPRVNRAWQEEAIDRGYGLYCPESGEFAWVGECEEQEKDDE